MGLTRAEKASRAKQGGGGGGVVKFIPKQSERGYGLKFKLETYHTVSNFKPGTKIKYGPNPKTKGSKSFTRYAGYMKAKTVGEALKLGSKLADLCWELQRGDYKILGGERSEAQEVAAIGRKDYDRAVKMLGCFQGPRGLSMSLNDPRAAEELKREEEWRARKLKKCEDIAKGLGLKPESVSELERLKIPECADVRFERRTADALAVKKLKEAAKAGRKISDRDVEEVLSIWGFAQNQGRFNVIPQGQKYVYSDTLGAIRRRTGFFGMTPPTQRYPNVPTLLNQWLADNVRSIGSKFVWTAINVNANYAAKIHRDQNNEGPSIIKAFGNFKGGRLQYWPLDTQRPKPKVETLRAEDGVAIDIRKDYAIFDGNRAHMVEPFKDGDRYSIVFFTAKGYKKVPATHLKALQKAGFSWPTPASMNAFRKSAAKVMPSPKLKKGAGPRKGGA